MGLQAKRAYLIILFRRTNMNRLTDGKTIATIEGGKDGARHEGGWKEVSSAKLNRQLAEPFASA